MADTIREFLVSLGFKVNDQQYKRFIAPISEATKQITGLGEASFAAAAAIFYSVDKIARQYEKLYYASQRTGQSVGYLQSYAFAAQQIGLTAEQASSSIEAMAAAIRMNPGLRGLAGAASTPAQLVARLKAQFGEAGYFVAARFGQMFGIDEHTFKHIWDNMARLRREEEHFAAKQKEMGIDATSAAAKFVDFGRAVNSLNASFNLLATRFALDWLPATQKGVVHLEALTQWLGRVDVATNGWALTIGGVLSASLATVILRLATFRAGLMLLRSILPFAAAAAIFEAIPKGAERPASATPYQPDKGSFGEVWGRGWAEILAKIISPDTARNIVQGLGGILPGATSGTGGGAPAVKRDMWGNPVTDPADVFSGTRIVPPSVAPYAGGRQSSLTQHTTITVAGGEANATAQRVAELQQRINGDLVRNLQGTLT